MTVYNYLGLARTVVLCAQAATLTRCTSEIPASEYAAPFGLLLLSRYPLMEIEAVDYHPVDPVVLPRGYISAKVESHCICLVHQSI